MATREQTVAHLIEASGGSVNGRIRIQKMVYLFQQLGLDAGFEFTYHHYGPYSEALTVSAQRAALIDKSIVEKEVPSDFGGYYSKFSLTHPSTPEKVGGIPFADAERLAARMKEVSSVVIELAATIHWLKHKEAIAGWQNELQRRKPAKASKDNIEEAEKLLRALNLV
jgi:uncharacterized protein